MKMLTKRCFFNLLCFFVVFLFTKVNGQKTYDKIRSQYENLSENNGKALPYVKLYIKIAKQEKNNNRLVRGYRDAAFYTSNTQLKLKYADSAIVSAKKTNDKEIISTVYLLKGSFYYFYYNNYSAALNEYLKAYDYSKDVKDPYLKYKIIYQMGLVKSYLGFYGEALKHFEECIAYFEPKAQAKNSPNEVYNDSKGYLNSLHQAIVCDRHLGNYQKADSLIRVGTDFTRRSKDFPAEKNYFLKSQGISDYYHKSYQNAVRDLTEALPLLRKDDDIYWVSVSEFYIGKSWLGMGKVDLAIGQFKKVDSLFQKRQFFFPELPENYNLLISYYKNKKEQEQELIYTNDLVKVHHIMEKDFPILSSKIHQDYDNQILTDAQSKLENRGKRRLGIILILGLAVVLLSFKMWKYYQNTKRINLRYAELEKRLQQHTSKPDPVSYDHIPPQSKLIISAKVFADLEKKLKDFEDHLGFKQSGLTVGQLAKTFNTNKSYLSQFINDTKGVSFSKYLSVLRISYITQLMYNDPKYLRHTVQGLAKECGIPSRSRFSDLFQEANGIRPIDFIRQRKAAKVVKA